MFFYWLRILFWVILVNPVVCFSQDFSACGAGENAIRTILNQIKTTNNDSLKITLNQKVSSVLNGLLQNPASFSYKFDSLPQFGKLESPDKLFRIITWNTIFTDGSYYYSGIIQVKEPKTGAIKLFELTDRADEVANRENSVLSAGKWYGSVYYKILKNKVDAVTYYTILGIRYNNLFTTSKIIEILYFDEFGNPVFGAPLFTDGKRTKLRVVFEYSANVAMNLKYNESDKMIVFDHLSASDPRFAGQYEFYGPDLSFDGFQFKNDKWQLVSDLNLNPTDIKKSSIPKRNPGSSKIGR
jgi:hypothetical protein